MRVEISAGFKIHYKLFSCDWLLYKETHMIFYKKSIIRFSYNYYVERLPALHYSVDFIFLSFGVMGFIVEL